MALESVACSGSHLFCGGDIAGVFEQLVRHSEPDGCRGFLVALTPGGEISGVSWRVVLDEDFKVLESKNVECVLFPGMVVGIGKFNYLELTQF